MSDLGLRVDLASTTGVITGAGSTVGVGGGMPGCNHAVLDAALASMSTWAFSR